MTASKGKNWLTRIRLVGGQVADVGADVLGESQKLFIICLENRRHIEGVPEVCVDKTQPFVYLARAWAYQRSQDVPQQAVGSENRTREQLSKLGAQQTDTGSK